MLYTTMVLRNVLSPTLLITVLLNPASGTPLYSSSDAIAPLYVPPVSSHDLFNNSYIVMLKDDVLSSAFSSHLRFLDLANEANPLQEEGSGVGISQVYDSIVAKGYSGKFSEDVIKLIRRRPEVKYVEQNQVVQPDNVQMNSPWVRLYVLYCNQTLTSYDFILGSCTSKPQVPAF